MNTGQITILLVLGIFMVCICIGGLGLAGANKEHEMQKFLITYRCESDHGVTYGYSFAEDPIEWVAQAQNHSDETYFLLNAQPMTEVQSLKYEYFKGM
ncbi:MAG: hypothetical protein KAS32_25600 [Candidatus Peribacteraceae bacterium]|nr:hypothetical protein [Candidatus Peribacteraceae bacterium]